MSQDVLEHLPMIERIAKHVARSKPQSIQVEDLIQVGVIGFYEAVEKFDPGKNTSFRTFWPYRVKGAMLDFIKKEAGSHGWDKHAKRHQAPLTALKKDKNGDLFEAVPEPIDPETPATCYSRQERREAFRKLEVRDRIVLSRYYGKDQTFSEIGPQIGVKMSRAVQLHNRALLRLRAVLEGAA